MTTIRCTAIGLLMACALTPAALAQTETRPASLRLFLDCNRNCDSDFVRTEISLVDFVRDRTEADVHVLITDERTGAGGRVYTLRFIGRRAFAALSDTLTYSSFSTFTDDERRRGLTDVIEMGLVRYLSRTTLASAIDLSLVQPVSEGETVTESTEEDPWNYWVFSVGGNGRFNGEEAFSNINVGGNVSANRTTEEWKIRLSGNGNFNERRFEVESGTISSTTRRGSVFGQIVNSIDAHWSVGGFFYANTSSQNNTEYSITGGPLIEYSIFPYSESTRREFRLNWGVRFDARKYEEVTIFNLKDERLLRHSFHIELDVEQAWGSMGFGAEFSHMLTNFERSLLDSYRLELGGGAEVRITGGLSIWFNGGYDLIRDQLFLPLSGASDEEILLGALSLPTGYEFNMSVGLNYRFGSIFNNVVNPRLDF